MITGRTSTGFEFSIDEKVLDDMELVDAIAETETNPTAISTVLTLLLGKRKKELYDHLRTEDGRVPVSSISEAVTEIFNAGGKETKNS